MYREEEIHDGRKSGPPSNASATQIVEYKTKHLAGPPKNTTSLDATTAAIRMTDITTPTGQEPRLRAPLGGPHVMFEGSFILEFLEVPKGLDASVLMKATYVGGHPKIKLGKGHPQRPPLHIHFSQSESFLVLSGAVGTTTTYDTIDTIHTPDGNFPRTTTNPPPSSLPRRLPDGTTHIPPYVPHDFWPVSPDHPFWATPQGKAHEATAPNGRDTDTTILVWSFPQINTQPAGKYQSIFPPDMDAAFFLVLLGMVDGLASKRNSMDLRTLGFFFAVQHESEAAMIMAPNWKVLGPLRWWVPWVGFAAVATVRRWLGSGPLVQTVDEFIDREVVKKQ